MARAARAMLILAICLPAGAVSRQSAAPSASETVEPPPSATLQPALDALQQALSSLRVEKWKSGTVRAEAVANIASIQKDVQSTLPALLAAADASPAAISKLLPVSRNVDALYDVLLRVVDGARIAASSDQADRLQQAAASLQKARLALGDRLQSMAAATEKQMGDLEANLRKAQASPAPSCPATPPASQPAPAAKKKVVKRKPAATPAAPANPNPQ